MRKIKAWLYFEWQVYKDKIKPYLKPTMAISFFLAWMITNGWAYLLAGLATGWLRGVAIGYITLLWLPFSPEKLITIPLSLFIQKKLFIKKEVRYESYDKTKKRQSVVKCVK